MNTSTTQETSADELGLRPEMEAQSPEQVEALTTFIDEDEVCHKARDPPSWMNLWKGAQPLPDQALGTVLSRPYQIANVTWDPGAGFSNIYAADVTALLMAIPQIREKLTYYRFFRFREVQIMVRVNATPWHYGAFCISHVPADADRVHREVVQQALNNDPVLVSAAAADDVNYSVPWSLPEFWLPLSDLGVSESGFTPFRFYIDDILPISMLGTVVKNAEIVIFANFVEPEVSGPRTNETLFVRDHGKVEEKPKDQDETEKKSEVGTFISQARDFIEPAVELAEFGAEVYKIGQALAALDKPTTVAATTMVQKYAARDMIYGEGLDNALKFALYPEAGITSDTAFNAVDEGSPKLLQLLSTPGFIGTWEFNDLTLKGALIVSHEIRPDALVPDLGFGKTVPTFLSWYSRPFFYWRGGLTFTYYVFASSFVTARIRVAFFPAGAAVPAIFSDNETGDVISKVFDITGDTCIKFSVPFLFPRLWAQYSEDVGHIGVYLTNVMCTVDTALTPTVRTISYVQAAPDFQVGFLGRDLEVGNHLTAPFVPPQAVKDHSCVWAQGLEPVESISPAASTMRVAHISQAENYDDIGTLMKRYSFFRSPQIVNGPVDHHVTTGRYDPIFTGTQFTLQNWFSMCHVYSRGGSRYKLFPPRDANHRLHWVAHFMSLEPLLAADSEAAFRPAPFWRRQTNYETQDGIAEFEIPYFATTPYEIRSYLGSVPGNVHSSLNDDTISTIDGNITVFRAASDDYQLGYLAAPPVMQFDTPVLVEESAVWTALLLSNNYLSHPLENAIFYRGVKSHILCNSSMHYPPTWKFSFLVGKTIRTFSGVDVLAFLGEEKYELSAVLIPTEKH